MLKIDWNYLGKGDTTTRKNLFLLGKPQKKSYFLNGSAIKRDGMVGKALAIKKYIHFFWDVFFIC